MDTNYKLCKRYNNIRVLTVQINLNNGVRKNKTIKGNIKKITCK